MITPLLITAYIETIRLINLLIFLYLNLHLW